VFQHSLTAGTFAATLVPLFVLLWKNGRGKVMAIAGLIACTVMTVCSNSSTPLMAYVAGVLGICLWPIRRKMKTVRRAIVISLLVLAVVMKAPVWFIIARIDLTGSSGGYHRAQLVDEFIRHFSDWWLIGVKELEAAKWGEDMWDQQNQFVNVGETGGLLGLCIFVTMLSRSYARIGRFRMFAAGTNREWLSWLLGAALFANLVGFFGVNYFDQSKVSWFVLLAMISATTASAAARPETIAVEPVRRGSASRAISSIVPIALRGR
jgi:hypothetical protein